MEKDGHGSGLGGSGTPIQTGTENDRFNEVVMLSNYDCRVI
jgi:hypothetical protein